MTFSSNQKPSYHVLVTGGAGFLGRHIVKEFLDPESPVNVGEIRVYDLAVFPERLQDDRLVCIQADIRDYGSLKNACHEIDMVIHSAAIVDWGTHSEQEVYAVNVEGTENVIRACKENGVPILIFTSSLDAVHDGKPLVDIDENQPYPEQHSNMYCKSKYLSEIAVIAENSEALKTCVLRPADIYGEGDPYHIDSLIDMAKKGFYVRLGNGTSRSQHVYVGNMAYAHILIAFAILHDKCAVCGEVYFITDGPGANFFKFFDQIVERAGHIIWPKNLWIPRWLAYTLGSLSEFFAWVVKPIRNYNPKFSRFAVIYTCTDFTFSSKKAEQQFDYRPKYNEKEALDRTISYYKKPLF
jgi:sterol-4alpha-carboxylate 3-dehydrogenase (decarboxylating)